MKVNIYYGGRGLLDDPTLYVLSKAEDILDELQVRTERYNLYEQKKSITTLPQTFKDADAIILASTVEWYGIGGYMHQFLDACWLYGDKQKIASIRMQPIVMSTTYGEKEGQLTLINAWEMLGGEPCDGLCGYVDNLMEFEANADFNRLIEKRIENLYRTISQKIKQFPSSNHAVMQNVLRTNRIDLTPQESEQLSKYVSDDVYVQKQKEDIEELTAMFKGLLSESQPDSNREFIPAFEKKFIPSPGLECKYIFIIEGKVHSLVVYVKENELNCYYSDEKQGDVVIKVQPEMIENIQGGHMTFQRAFMTGAMSAKGEFKLLRMLDNLFPFSI